MRKKLIFILVFTLPFLALAQNNSAFVVTNYNYPSKPIENGMADGENVAKSLSNLKFNVTKEFNLNQAKFQNSLENFVANTKGNDIVLFYYRGYAAQSNGKNYIIPTGTAIFSKTDISLYGLKFDDVIATLQKSDAKRILVFLDCCDENSWQKLDSKARDGLTYTRIPGEKETLLMFAQSLYKTSVQFEPNESLFTKFFIREFSKADAGNIDIKTVCSKIAADIKWYSEDAQIPWINSTLQNWIVQTDLPPESDDLEGVAAAQAQEIAAEIKAENEDQDSPLEGIDELLAEETPEPDEWVVKGSPGEYIKLPTFRHIIPKKKIHPYEIAFFGVNYSVYLEIRSWAKSQDRGENVYRFRKILSEDEYTKLRIDDVSINGQIKDGTTLDAMVWVNALNEYFGLPPVYYEVPSNVVFRDATKDDVLLVTYLNQEGYRFPLKKEKQYALKEALINSHYKGYLLAASTDDLSTYPNPMVKIKKDLSIGRKFAIGALNMAFGTGSYIEGEIPLGIAFTSSQVLGLGATGFGIFYALDLQNKQQGNGQPIDYSIPNLLVGGGIGVYGVSAVLGFIMPFIHPPTEKRTFSVPKPSGEIIEIEFDFAPEISPSGDLGMAMMFRW